MQISLTKIAALFFAFFAFIGTLSMALNVIYRIPDKISVEWQSNLLFNLVGALAIITSTCLSYGLMKLKKWVLYLYNTLLGLWLLFFFFLVTNSSQSALVDNWLQTLLCLMLFIGIPIYFSIHIQREFRRRKNPRMAKTK